MKKFFRDCDCSFRRWFLDIYPNFRRWFLVILVRIAFAEDAANDAASFVGRRELTAKNYHGHIVLAFNRSQWWSWRQVTWCKNPLCNSETGHEYMTMLDIRMHETTKSLFDSDSIWRSWNLAWCWNENSMCYSYGASSWLSASAPAHRTAACDLQRSPPSGGENHVIWNLVGDLTCEILVFRS